MNKRSNFSVLEIREFEHGLFGVGDVRYIYNPNVSELTIYISGKFHRIYKNSKAKDIYEKVSGDIPAKELLTIDNYKSVACTVCGVAKLSDLYTTREDRVYFARSLIFWTASKKLGLTFADCGALFNRDHSTAHTAVNYIERQIDKDGRPMRPHHLRWKISYLKRINAIENKLK